MPDNSDETEPNEIVVTGDRINDDDSSGVGGGGFWGGWFGTGGDDFDFGRFGGLGGGGSSPPPDEDVDEEPEIVVTAPRPSDGQEDFADDGDPFNDGEAPTYDTIFAWLENWRAEGGVLTYNILSLDPDNPDAYRGTYETFDGRRYEFESDGGENYENFLRSAPLPEPAPPIDPGDIAFLDGHVGFDFL